MTALELADWLERDGIALPEDWEAAAMLRKQDAAIKTLRGVLRFAINQNNCEMQMTGDELRYCKAALAATEDFK